MIDCLDDGDHVQRKVNMDEVVKTEIILNPSPLTGKKMRSFCWNKLKYNIWVPHTLVLMCLLRGPPEADEPVEPIDPPQENCMIRDNLLNNLYLDAIETLNQTEGVHFYNVEQDSLIDTEAIVSFFPNSYQCYAK